MSTIIFLLVFVLLSLALVGQFRGTLHLALAELAR